MTPGRTGDNAKLALSAEQATLMKAAMPRASRDGAAGSVGRGVRWDRLVESARWHRLGPLLWRHINAVGLMPPPDAIEAMRAESRGTAVRNVVLGAHLDRVLATLAKRGVPAMLLKGSALVRTVYPDPALRPMSDLDVLVPPEIIRDAQRWAEEMGYRSTGVSLGRDDERQLTSHFHHFPLVSPNGAVTLELHRHVTWAGPEFDISGFWERAEPGVGSVAHLIPSPEDLLIHLAIHFADDRVWRRPFALGQLADLLWLADRRPLNWDAVGQRAHAYGLSDRVFLAMMTIDHLVEGVVPPALISRLTPESFRPRAGEQFVLQRVLRSRHSMPFEYLARGHFRWRGGVVELAGYVGADEESPPSLRQLRLRRFVGLLRKILRALPAPRELINDLALSRWILTLRTGVSEKGKSEASQHIEAPRAGDTGR